MSIPGGGAVYTINFNALDGMHLPPSVIQMRFYLGKHLMMLDGKQCSIDDKDLDDMLQSSLDVTFVENADTDDDETDTEHDDTNSDVKQSSTSTDDSAEKSNEEMLDLPPALCEEDFEIKQTSLFEERMQQDYATLEIDWASWVLAADLYNAEIGEQTKDGPKNIIEPLNNADPAELEYAKSRSIDITETANYCRSRVPKSIQEKYEIHESTFLMTICRCSFCPFVAQYDRLLDFQRDVLPRYFE